MCVREDITKSAATSFKFGVLAAIATLISTDGDIEAAATYGAATTIARTACDALFSFFIPKNEHPPHKKKDEPDAEDERKYIDERTEKSN